MTQDKDLDLGPIEARLKAATPGPWKYYKGAIHPTLEFGASVNDDQAICGEFYGPQSSLNSNLIANSPTDLASLITEVKKLREQVAAYENGLQCLEGFISQFPGYVMLQQMIKIWFSDARGTEV